jgi:hypothetical protein
VAGHGYGLPEPLPRAQGGALGDERVSGQPDANGAAHVAYLYRVIDENERLQAEVKARMAKDAARLNELEAVRATTAAQLADRMVQMDVFHPTKHGYVQRMDQLLRMLSVHQAIQNPPINPNEPK